MSDLRKPVFDIDYKGFNVKAFYREPSEQYADIVITRDGKPFKTGEYLAYRIWNIAAHFNDMVEDFLADEALEAKHEGS